MATATMEKRSRDGVETTLIRRGRLSEASISVHVNGISDLAGMLAEAWAEVQALGLTVLRQDVFGIPAQHKAATAMLRDVCGAVDWPVTWLEEGASLGERLTGTHLYAVSGVDVRRIRQDGAVVGSVFSDGDADYCHLGGIVSHDLSGGRSEQARGVLERLESALESAGMAFTDIARTWFYNDRILEWYAEFNAVRTQFFKERGVFDRLVPASTGIGGGNLQGAALVAEALAVKSHRPDSSVRVFEVKSPLQCPATNYRSSFSRAVEVATTDHRKLFVSGTASIAPEGHTVRVGDVVGQIQVTLDVVEAILKSREMSWTDVSRAIAYVKHGQYIEDYIRVLARRGMAALPAIVTENDICRDDLLFELEVDAWADHSGA